MRCRSDMYIMRAVSIASTARVRASSSLSPKVAVLGTSGTVRRTVPLSSGCRTTGYSYILNRPNSYLRPRSLLILLRSPRPISLFPCIRSTERLSPSGTLRWLPLPASKEHPCCSGDLLNSALVEAHYATFLLCIRGGYFRVTPLRQLKTSH